MPGALIVDDARAMRMLLANLAAELNFSPILEAANGHEALATIHNSRKIDVVLIDLNMPVMDGITLIKEIRMREEWDHMRLVVVTTESEMEKVNEAMSAGANKYLMKPMAPIAIKKALEEFAPPC